MGVDYVVEILLSYKAQLVTSHHNLYCKGPKEIRLLPAEEVTHSSSSPSPSSSCTMDIITTIIMIIIIIHCDQAAGEEVSHPEEDGKCLIGMSN